MLIDANIFLEVLLNQEKEERCRLFLNKTVMGEIRAIVPDFVIDSVCIIMNENKIDAAKIKLFLKRIRNSKGLLIYSISMEDRLRAMDFMKSYNLSYEDAVVLQSAISSDSKKIVSFDKHFDNIKGIKRVEP